MLPTDMSCNRTADESVQVLKFAVVKVFELSPTTNDHLRHFLGLGQIWSYFRYFFMKLESSLLDTGLQPRPKGLSRVPNKGSRGSMDYFQQHF